MAQSGELEQQIEDLALQLVVGNSWDGLEASAWLSALEQIRETAVSEHAAQVAGAASEAIDAVNRAQGSHAEGAGSIPAELQEGIVRLQQAVEGRKQETGEAAVSLAQDPELLSDFIVESREHLADVEAQLLTLERTPRDSEALHAVFRGFHSIKGLAGFLELWEVQALAHEVETVLDRARSTRATLTTAAIDVILQSADQLNRWLAHVEALLQNRASDPPPRDSALLSRIAALSVESPELPGLDAPPELAATTPSVEIGADGESPSGPVPAARVPANGNETRAIKVDTAKLDYLVDMVGEMVIAESLVRNDPELGIVRSPQFQRKIAHLTRITAELQKTAMSMRLVPIGPLFQRMARLVRDLSRQFGKQVELETQGDDIDLDRTIVEELADPLMHMVRNAMDHGIESPKEREALGKNPVARLFLRAHHRAGLVVIEIADDGRGLDAANIKNKAIQKGLIKPDQELSDIEIFNLIFQPGFTTAAQVTNVSGRGVGMDVVRRHIEKLRGRIEIRSSPGRGAAFVLKLPLTLAIIEGLVVLVGEERYILPLFAIREMFRPTAETIWTVKQRAEMALVRGSLLPVLRLHRLFGVEKSVINPLDGVLVVAEVEGQRFCVLVDQLIGKQEVVIKPLGETFKNVHGIAGGAILGDGRVGLIVDLERLFKERQSDASL